jgi:hypothetical protein
VSAHAWTASSAHRTVGGPNDGSGQFTIPQRPIRRRVLGIPAFVVNRGCEYFFFPSLSALLRWVSEPET